jgi:GNAT superfamily N-acetyltransferase
VRDAEPRDVARICEFGATHVPPHYAPLIGPEAAEAQVRNWWTEAQIGAAVARGLVVVAEVGHEIVGVGQRGRNGEDHVVYKLYVHPEQRGRRLGPQILAALVRQLPDDADRLYIEHFAANARAGAFYEREGYAVDRVEASTSGDPALDQVWRVRQL